MRNEVSTASLWTLHVGSKICTSCFIALSTSVVFLMTAPISSLNCQISFVPKGNNENFTKLSLYDLLQNPNWRLVILSVGKARAHYTNTLILNPTLLCRVFYC